MSILFNVLSELYSTSLKFSNNKPSVKEAKPTKKYYKLKLYVLGVRLFKDKFSRIPTPNVTFLKTDASNLCSLA